MKQPGVRRNLLIGGCLTTAGVLLLLIGTMTPLLRKIVLLSGTLISLGFVLVALSLITTWYGKKTGCIDDERTLKIRAYTHMKAFLCSMTVIVVLIVLISSGMLVVDAGSALIIILLAMGLSSSLLSWYYNRQGDIG